MPFSGPCLSMPMLGSPLRRPATVELLWHGRLELILPGPGSATWSWCCWGFKVKGQWWSIQVSKASWRIHYRHLTASKWKWVTGIAASSYYSRPGKHHRYLCVTIDELRKSCKLNPARYLSPLNGTLLGSFCGPVAPNAYCHHPSSPRVAVRFNCFKSSRYWSKATPDPSAFRSLPKIRYPNPIPLSQNHSPVLGLQKRTNPIHIQYISNTKWGFLGEKKTRKGLHSPITALKTIGRPWPIITGTSPISNNNQPSAG